MNSCEYTTKTKGIDDTVTAINSDLLGANMILKGLLQETDINDYCKMWSKNQEHMQFLYGIILGNVDQNMITLIESDQSFVKISQEHEPIKLNKLLCKMYRKEKGMVCSSNTLICAIGNLVTCKQSKDNIIDYVQTIKLKSDVIPVQYDDAWLPYIYKYWMIGYHPDKKWSGDTFYECNGSTKHFLTHEQKIDSLLTLILKNAGICRIKIQGGGTSIALPSDTSTAPPAPGVIHGSYWCIKETQFHQERT